MGALLCTHPSIQKVSFTGSTDVGKVSLVVGFFAFGGRGWGFLDLGVGVGGFWIWGVGSCVWVKGRYKRIWVFRAECG